MGYALLVGPRLQGQVSLVRLELVLVQPLAASASLLAQLRMFV